MLSILCVTRMEPHASFFLQCMSDLADVLGAEWVLLADGHDAFVRAVNSNFAAHVFEVQSKGYVESVLDLGVSYCQGDYILRLDDDEKCSPAMVEWLFEEEYTVADHWKFATANMWGDADHFLLMPPVWPDHHTRLSIKAQAGGRHTPHAGSPFGGGELAPVILEHHKFLVKSFERRQEIAAGYDRFAEGYGTSDAMRPFSLPELSYDKFLLAYLGDGVLDDIDDGSPDLVEVNVRHA